MNKFTPEKRSKIMSAIRSRDTLPEIVVRKWLFAQGFRFRVCDNVKHAIGMTAVVLAAASGCTERFMQPPHISRLIFAYAYTIIYA